MHIDFKLKMVDISSLQKDASRAVPDHFSKTSRNGGPVVPAAGYSVLYAADNYSDSDSNNVVPLNYSIINGIPEFTGENVSELETLVKDVRDGLKIAMEYVRIATATGKIDENPVLNNWYKAVDILNKSMPTDGYNGRPRQGITNDHLRNSFMHNMRTAAQNVSMNAEMALMANDGKYMQRAQFHLVEASKYCIALLDTIRHNRPYEVDQAGGAVIAGKGCIYRP